MEKEIYNTPIRRAYYLLNAYNQKDNLCNRGQGDLTPEWIVENIFSKPCAHCGITGWNVIGCNRLDNSKPHTMDNVEPCCRSCNCRLNAIDNLSIKVYQYTSDNELIAVWENARFAADELGFDRRNICSCCNGKRKKANGYKWSYEPL